MTDHDTFAVPTSSIARVYLVGAGPGHAGLLTLRGAECLRRAALVLYDYLVNPRILQHAPRAEKICLGRHGRGRIWSLDEVLQTMIAAARQGKIVVRLKSGDPVIFGRGAEESAALVQAGIPFEIVPGVTAALAAGSYAGIPITHRDLASAVALVTGREDDGKAESSLDFAGLAQFPGTLVMYMGVTTARHWTAALIQAGKPAHTPAAIVRRCSWPDQLVVRCTLATVAEELERRKLRPPVIVIVGAVVQLAPLLDWFAHRPLFGRTVLLTRPAAQADDLANYLEELGAGVIHQPAIDIVPPEDWGPVDTTIARLAEFNWVVFSSSNGVRYFLDRLLAGGLDVRRLGNCQLAVVGPGTAAALAQYHLRPDVQPAEFRAESLVEALNSACNSRQRMLLIRASRGREVLAELLLAAGHDVTQVVCYQSRDVAAPEPEIHQALRAGRIDWITVTSSAIARSLARMFGDDLQRARLVSISPVTTATLRELGHSPAAEARTYTMAGVVQAMREWEQENSPA